MASEFAREFPDIASRLAIEDFRCPDPYVERLLEGFAFLAARVQLKIDAEFPRFTQSLLETAFPHYLAPTPSMCVVQFEPNFSDAALNDGVPVPRGTVLRSPHGIGTGDRTMCEYRTAHGLRLWPARVSAAAYVSRELGMLDLPASCARTRTGAPVRSGVVITLSAPPGTPFAKTKLDSLPVHLRGPASLPSRLLERLVGHAAWVVVRAAAASPRERAAMPVTVLPGSSIKRVGHSQAESLLPYDARSFQGYRLLAEYFAFPQRFLFAEFTGLSEAVRQCAGNELEIIALFDDENPELENAVNASNFGLYCTPAVNLFPKRADRIYISERVNEFQVIPDRTRPLDFEVHTVGGVTGFGVRTGEEREFRPLFAAQDTEGDAAGAAAYFVVNRVPRAMSETKRASGRRSSYGGSEVYLSIVDAQAVPYSPDLRQLAVETLCTNRDLPLYMPVGKGRTDFTLEIGLPLERVRVVAGPTPPKPSHAEGEFAWRLINHQSLNYLSLSDAEHGQASGAFKDILRLYGDLGDPTVRKQIDAVRSIQTKQVTRRAPTPGPICFARGLEVTITIEESGFEGLGSFVFAGVVEQFLARAVTMNSFTETVVRSVERGEIVRWPARLGARPLL